MKPKKTYPFERDYPYLIKQDGRHNMRRQIVVSCNRIPGASSFNTFVGNGLLKTDGSITEKARTEILNWYVNLARSTNGAQCVVWSAESCTYIDSDGRETHDDCPPVGVSQSVRDFGRLPIALEEVQHVSLPKGSAAPFLCVRRLDDQLVELSAGEHIVLGCFDDVPPDGDDPAQPYEDENGNLLAMEMFRGQKVHTIRDRIVFGPVQPVDEGTILRNPWPQDVARACERIAGRQLSRTVTDGIWRAIDLRTALVSSVPC